MANLEREYIVPLRREWLKCARHKRAKKAIRALKQFLARHMKADEEDVKLSKWVNQKIWGKGIKHPPAKIKLKVSKDDKGIVKAELSELSEKAKKIEAKDKARSDSLKKDKDTKKAEEKKEEKVEEQTKEEIKEEEKGKEEKKEEEKIMHEHDRPEEPKSTAPTHEHQREKVKPIRQALRK